MSLSPGDRLGSYEVTASIGAGAMGEVYRARDTKLDRDIALKILPAAFASDAERLMPAPSRADTWGTGTPRILVAYASASGSTREIAEFIGRVLGGLEAEVDVESADHAGDPASYDAVIVGSAIRYDRWMPEARSFVKAHEESLRRLPVAYFLACLAASGGTAKTERQTLAYAEKVRALAPSVEPVSFGRFAGKLEYRKLSLLVRLLSRALFVIMRVREGDYRDWNAIEAWAKDCHRELSRAGRTTREAV
jgi:menaquinone-dependent protoporphyrinogen oxidase